MKGYIEVVEGGMVSVRRQELHWFDRLVICRFTRKNVQRWMKDWLDWYGFVPVDDFHAVWGNKEIPWATEEAKQYFERVWERSGRQQAVS